MVIVKMIQVLETPPISYPLSFSLEISRKSAKFIGYTHDAKKKEKKNNRQQMVKFCPFFVFSNGKTGTSGKKEVESRRNF